MHLCAHVLTMIFGVSPIKNSWPSFCSRSVPVQGMSLETMREQENTLNKVENAEDVFGQPMVLHWNGLNEHGN